MAALALAALLFVQGAPSSFTGVVTGQVRGLDGAVAAGVRVFVITDNGEPPTAGVQTVQSSTQTDTTGHYRLEDIPPGRYIVAAGLLDMPTYYPGVARLAAARGIVVSAAQTLAGIDFRLVESSGVHVSGRVRGLPKGTPEGIVRAVLSAVSGLPGSGPREVAVQPDGSFEILRVPPGVYNLRFTPNITSSATAVRIEVRDQDVGPLDFSVGPAVLGRVEIEGGGVLPLPMNAPLGLANVPPLVRLQAIPTKGSSTTAPVIQMRQDGTFLWFVPGGEFKVAVTQLPFGFSVKSIVLGAVNLLETPLEVGGPETSNADMIVTLTTKPSSDETAGVQVMGRVTGLPSDPSLNEFWVRMQTAAPAGTASGGPAQQRIGETQVKPDGTFAFPRVPSGIYTVQVFPRGAPDIARMTGLVVRDSDVNGVQLMTMNPPALRLASAAAPQVLADVRPAALQASLASIGGSTAKDCGHASLAKYQAGAATEIIKCAEDAIEKKTAFLVSLQQQGIDSIVITGLAAPPQGGVVSALFDSMGANVSVRPCANPKLNATGPVAALRCE